MFVPLCFGGHVGLFLPKTRFFGNLVHPNHKILWEDRLRMIAEATAQSHAFNFGVTDLSDEATRFIGESLSEIDDDMRLTFAIGVAFDRRAHRSRHLGHDVIF